MGYDPGMFKRQRTGSVVCPSCGNLVGVNDERCYNCGRWNPGMWGFAPLLRRLGNDFGFTSIVIGGSATLYLLSLLVSGRGVTIISGMNILVPADYAIILFGASGSYPVFVLGEPWTILSASWLHGSALHILFNMMWVRQLGPDCAEMYGASRTVIIYTIAGAAGFLVSTLAGTPLTLGASAGIMGLLGAAVRYGQRTGSSRVSSQAWSWALVLFVFGFLMRGVDNWAHGGGFAGGYLAAMLLDPVQRERQAHVFVAVGCLGLSLLSVLASLAKGLTLIR
jgi:rhomboid protease GluP